MTTLTFMEEGTDPVALALFNFFRIVSYGS